MAGTWTINVYANPARPGILHPNASQRFIACDRDHAASIKAGKHRFALHPRPHKIELPEGHAHCAYYARLVRDGDLFAADQATVDACKGGQLVPTDLLEKHVSKLEAQAKAEAEEAKKLAAPPKVDEEALAKAKAEEAAKREELAKRIADLEPKQKVDDAAKAPQPGDTAPETPVAKAAEEHDHIPLEHLETEPPPPHAA